jgi:spore maturation protein CgeB
MKFVVFGLTISSSWGNGHATLLRGLFRALVRRGHTIVFFERDVPYYAANRDVVNFEGIRLRLYDDWNEALEVAASELSDADVGMVTSYCFDGIAASELVLNAAISLRVFYDLDAPVTLSRISAGNSVSYIGSRGLRDFDLVLSYTGGRALDGLRNLLHAQIVAPLYGSVDPLMHHRVAEKPQYRADLSYIGTYAQDRQAMLENLFITPARQLAEDRFVIAGAEYPIQFPWSPNIYFVRHLPPHEHSAFYSSSRVTLNVTRSSMTQMGYCPSGRLFEAAACGTPIITDLWEGLEQFFTPSSEILVAQSSADTVNALSLLDAELYRISAAARERVMEYHTADRRAQDLEHILNHAFRKDLVPYRAQPESTSTMET